jgi:gas vesicle protein
MSGLVTGVVVGALAALLVCGLLSIYYQAKARRRRMSVLHEDRWRER